MPITANTAKAERALHDSKKPDKDNHKQGLGGARYSGPPSALQKRAVSYRTTLAFPPHTRQPLFLQDASTFPGQINVLCMTAGKNAIKRRGTDEPVKVSENKQGNAKEYPQAYPHISPPSQYQSTNLFLCTQMYKIPHTTVKTIHPLYMCYRLASKLQKNILK